MTFFAHLNFPFLTVLGKKLHFFFSKQHNQACFLENKKSYVTVGGGGSKIGQKSVTYYLMTS